MEQNNDLLNSWKEISKYVDRGVRTVQRWERDFGFPVRRPAGHVKSCVIALRSDIDLWMATRDRRTGEVQQKRKATPCEECAKMRSQIEQLRQQLAALQQVRHHVETGASPVVLPPRVGSASDAA